MDVGAEHATILRGMDENLVLRGFVGEHTRELSDACPPLFSILGSPCRRAGDRGIRRFLTFLLAKEHLSPNTVNVYSTALRFLFAVTLNRPLHYLPHSPGQITARRYLPYSAAPRWPLCWLLRPR